jgi:hypothetical protein
MQNLPAIVSEWLIVVFIGALALLVLIKLWKVDLSGLVSEPGDTPAPGAPAPGAPPPVATAAGKASISRLQLLLFTFVIAGLYLILCLEAGQFIEIPNQVLGLLGISGGSYVISKGIQMNS